MWRIDGDRPQRLRTAYLPTEATLEDYLAHDPSLLGDRLLVIGRQVRTPHGKLIDLVAIDAEGNLHVLELKRHRTPRAVVAQVLDYGSWVAGLDRDSVIDIANDHLPVPFETAFADVFGDSDLSARGGGSTGERRRGGVCRARSVGNECAGERVCRWRRRTGRPGCSPTGPAPASCDRSSHSSG